MNREISTIGSKANDGLISLWVVDLKRVGENEEQVQNISDGAPSELIPLGKGLQ